MPNLFKRLYAVVWASGDSSGHCFSGCGDFESPDVEPLRNCTIVTTFATNDTTSLATFQAFQSDIMIYKQEWINKLREILMIIHFFLKNN